METFSLCFALWIFFYWFLIAQMGQAIEGVFSWYINIFLFGVVVFLTGLGLFLFLFFVATLAGAFKQKKERIKADETLRTRSVEQIRELINQITLK
jgi:hypothetical protein